MKALIELENMAFHAPHGCYDLEKQVGNRYEVTLTLEAEVGTAPEQDSLEGSVSYLEAYEIVRREIAVPSNIIENAAWRIARAVREAFPAVVHATVKVSKLAPPVGGKVEKASATLTL